jgi:hypothetical protein
MGSGSCAVASFSNSPKRRWEDGIEMDLMQIDLGGGVE